jgi:Ca-activated chloride channel family protein
MMPTQGSRAERALDRAFELFNNSAVVRGDILLVSDGLDDAEAAGIEAELNQRPDFRLSILAIGTPEGGPIPLNQGGFLKDGNGAIVIARLLEKNLRRIAQSGSGAYATITTDDRDINTLVYAIEPKIVGDQASLSDSTAELWREAGPWLLLLLIPLVALTFRRGVLWVIPLTMMLLPPDASALDWNSLWQNQDQRAGDQFERGEHARAAELFNNQDWKASSLYRAGDYQAALEQWQQLDNEAALYNRGNALAQLGRYDDAIKAYEHLLQQNPEHEDASYNKQRLEALLQEQQNQQQQSDQPNQNKQDQNKPDQAEQQQSEQDTGESEQAGSDSDDQSEPSAQSEREQQEQSAQQSDDQQQQAQGEVAKIDQQMSEQAAEQWLRKIPDDPGGLLRRKFLYQYRQRGKVDKEAQGW